MPESLDVSRARNGSFSARARRPAGHTLRRFPWNRRAKTDNGNLFPLLIQVLAGFSKVDGRILEEEIDSSLGFLPYDYPEAVYSELRLLFQKALKEPQDLSAMAKRLAQDLTQDRKIMLGLHLPHFIATAPIQP